MSELHDNTVVQDGLKMRDRGMYPGDNVAKIGYPVRAQVLNVYTIDLEDNADGETSVCDLHVSSLGIDLTKVPFLLQKAGVDNYIHYGPISASGNVDKSQFDSRRIDPSVSNGDTVIVSFIDGDVRQGVIIGVQPHSQSGFGGVSPDTRPASTDGDVYKVRMNGMNMLIDDDGNVSFKSTKTFDESIPRNKKFTILLQDPDKNQAISIQVDNSLGAPIISMKATKEDGTYQELTLDAQNHIASIVNQISGGMNKITMDSTGVKVDVKGKCVITSSDETDITCTKAVINASGAVDLTAGGNVVVAGAQIQLNGSSGMVLTTVTDPVVDLITGAPTVGVPTVLAG